MPYVEVKVWEGFGAQKAKRVMEGITQVFVGLGVPAQAVSVVVQEIPKTHWGMGGVPAAEGVPSPPEGKPAGP